MSQQLLNVSDLLDIVIEEVVDKDTGDFKDIRVRYPKGVGYDPEVVSLVDAGIVNAFVEDGEDDEIFLPKVNIEFYGHYKKVEE